MLWWNVATVSVFFNSCCSSSRFWCCVVLAPTLPFSVRSKHDAEEELGAEEERLNWSELCSQFTTS